MTRLLIVFAVSAIIVLTAAFSQQVLAQNSLSEGHVERIRQNCGVAQTTLRQLRDNDVGLRNDRGALYDDISSKLMVPLNSRIVNNKFDGLKLGSITLNYDKQIDMFRSSWTEYAKSMERTLAIDCTNNPVEFHESVSTSREKRQRLYQENRAVITLLQSYSDEFNAFRTEVEQ